MAKRRCTMNISVTPQMERLVGRLVKSGRYQSASEIFREGLRFVHAHATELQGLQRKINDGLDDADNGRLRPVEHVMAVWTRRDRLALKKLGRKRKSA